MAALSKASDESRIKIAKEAEHLADAAKIAHFADGANEIIEFLNRIGVKNAEKWLLALRFEEHMKAILEKFGSLMVTLNLVLQKTGKKVEVIAPSLAKRILQLRDGFATVLKKGNEMIPDAIKELDQKLRELQAYIHSGGETTSRLALHEVATGEKVTTRAEERRLVEDGMLPARTSRGGFKQNPARASDLGDIAKRYKKESGYPDLTKRISNGQYDAIAAFSGKMVNRELKKGEEMFRFFGPARTTHGVAVGDASAGGAWWGLGRPPKTAKEWREWAAVLDSFNGDGFCITARVIRNKGPKAVVGTVSEQFGSKIPGQYLAGGATQAVLDLDKTFNDVLKKFGEDFIAGSNASTFVDHANGLEFTIHKTGWTDSNGIWGYLHFPGTGTVQTARVASREHASKQNNQVVVHP